MDKTILKKIGIALGAVAFFLALSYGFVPKVLQGQIVDQSDISGYVGMSREMTEWNKAHPDDPTYWTDSMFGGMPTTAISTRNTGDLTQGLYDLLLTGKRPATYLFIALLGAFLLMLSLGIDWKIALENSHWRRRSNSFLFIQLPDYPGRAQYQDAGYRLHAMGLGGNGLHV